MGHGRAGAGHNEGGSVDHEKLLDLVAQGIADGRLLRLIEAILKAGSYGEGNSFQLRAGLRRAGSFSLAQ
jgi:hypothetical protein